MFILWKWKNGKMTSTQNIWGKLYRHLENHLSSQYFLKIFVSKKGILKHSEKC
jgi:hypothetical protein